MTTSIAGALGAIEKAREVDLSAVRDAGAPPARLALLDADAVDDMAAELAEYIPDDLLPLWRCEDQPRTFFGLYVDGLLQGFVARIVIGDYDVAPVFATPASLYAAYASASERPRDELPFRCGDAIAPDLRARCAEVVRDLDAGIAEMSEEDRREYDSYYAWLMDSALVLSPPPSSKRIERGLRDENMYVQETACIVAGAHRDDGVVDLLASLAADGRGNGALASFGALAEIGTDRAREALRNVAARVPSNRQRALAHALEKLG